MAGRSLLKYHTRGCKTLSNFRPSIQGPAEKRKGARYVAEVKDSSAAIRLVKFVFSEIDSYVLEFGNNYIRFFQGEAQIDSGGSPYEIVSPYATADISALKFAQLGDVMYIAHPSYRPRKLTRLGATNWTIAEVDNRLGPVEDVNETTTTITVTDAAEGATDTWTASASIFQSGHVGSVWAIADSSNNNIGYARMTAFTSGTVATFENQTALFGTTASVNWYEASWSGVRGYPRAVAFHEQRLFFGGTDESPLAVYGSVSGGVYENFDKGDASDDDGLRFELSGQINTIQSLISKGNFLVATTFGGLSFIGSSSSTTALTPTNVKANVGASFGSSTVQAVELNSLVNYLSSNGRSLYEAVYDDVTLNYTTVDLNDINNEILSAGASYVDTVEQPDLAAAIVADGDLKFISRDRQQEIIGWYEYEFGGSGEVESVAVIPTTGFDRIWISVKRTINSATKRYVEFIEIDDIDFYVDSGIKVTGAATRSFSGLDHLEGEEVVVLGDGAFAGTYTVSSGSITIPDSKNAIETAYIGYAYNADLETMPLHISSSATGGVIQTLKARTNEVQLYLYKTLGLEVGQSFDDLVVLPNRNENSQMDTAPTQFGATYPEVKQVNFNQTWSRDPSICIRSNLPFPATIVSMMARMEVESQ